MLLYGLLALFSPSKSYPTYFMSSAPSVSKEPQHFLCWEFVASKRITLNVFLEMKNTEAYVRLVQPAIQSAEEIVHVPSASSPHHNTDLFSVIPHHNTDLFSMILPRAYLGAFLQSSSVMAMEISSRLSSLKRGGRAYVAFAVSRET
jgi:hypothetical protein